MTSLQQGGRMQTWLRFGAAGMVNTLVSIACYQVALFFMGPVPAYLLGYAVGVVLSYTLYAHQVFHTRPSARSLFVFTVFYGVMGLIGSGLNALLAESFHIHERLVIVITIALLLPVNYLGSRACLNIGRGRT